MLSAWGILISFWSVLVFSAFFWLFFHGTICLRSFAFPGAFLVSFLRGIGGILLSLYVVADSSVLARSSVALFKIFSMPTTRPSLNNR